MELLKRLWASLREPVEEFVKLVLARATDPLIADPGMYLLPRLPESARPTVEAFLATAEGKAAVVEILRVGQNAALDAIDQINPADNAA